MRFRAAVYPQIWIITAIFSFVIIVAIWQRDFVIAGASSNIYLNGAIFLGIAFGVALQYWNLWSLKDEFLALDALREAYNDTHQGLANSGEELRGRSARLREPALVLPLPNYLGSSFKLLYPPLLRDQTLKIPSATAKQMVEDVESRFSTTFAFGNYIAGLMVLLGLLGTFIGLLATVGSVGEILASLDFSAGAGVEQISQLMKSLEAPLGGMATGFSSSLFGLIGSLMLGLMAKVANRSYNFLLVEFEDWINRVAQVEQMAGSTADEPDSLLSAHDDENMPISSRYAVRCLRTIIKNQERSNAKYLEVCAALDKIESDGRITQSSTSNLVDINKAIMKHTQSIVQHAEIERDRLIARDQQIEKALDRVSENFLALSKSLERASERHTEMMEARSVEVEKILSEMNRLGASTAIGVELFNKTQKSTELLAGVLLNSQDRAEAFEREMLRYFDGIEGHLQRNYDATRGETRTAFEKLAKVVEASLKNFDQQARKREQGEQDLEAALKAVLTSISTGSSAKSGPLASSNLLKKLSPGWLLSRGRPPSSKSLSRNNPQSDVEGLSND